MHTLCDMNPTDLLPSAAVCEELDINRSTLSRWVSAGLITPAIKMDGLRGPMLFHPSEVERIKADRIADAS